MSLLGITSRRERYRNRPPPWWTLANSRCLPSPCEDRTAKPHSHRRSVVPSAHFATAAVTPAAFHYGQRRSDELSTLRRSGRSFHEKLLDMIFPLVIPTSVCLDPRGITCGLVRIGRLSSSRHLQFGVVLPLSPGKPFSFPCQFNS